MEAPNNVEKKGRLRSPNYPAYTLQEGLERAKKLFATHLRRAVALEVAAQDWGISPTSGYISQLVAALSYYGLIETEGTKGERKIKISDLAYRVFIDKRPDSRDRENLIKEAALKPEIFRKLFEIYRDNLPADHALEFELVAEHKFNPNSVHDFIRIFKETLDFAKVYESDMVEAESFPFEEEKMITAPDKNPVSETISTSIVHPSVVEGGYEFGIYRIGRNQKARILILGEPLVTQKAIEKLVQRLNTDKEDLPESDDEERQPS